MPEISPLPRRVAVVAITRHGIALAGRVVAVLPGARLVCPEKFHADGTAAAPGAAQPYAGKLGEQMADLFGGFDAIVALISLGAVIRLMAPHLQDKERDPAVVVIDEAGQYVIPVLAGHRGGANALAGQLAAALGAQAVLTTASDVRQTLAVDLLGRELGWRLEADHDTLVRCSAAMVNGAPVALVQEAGAADWWHGHANGRHGPLPANLVRLSRLEKIDPEVYAAILWVSERQLPADIAPRLAGKCIIYRP